MSNRAIVKEMNSKPPFILISLSMVFLSHVCSWSRAEEPKPAAKEKIVFKTEWKGERIELPPAFAPGMGLKGVEEIRFAPGMFDPKSESFFSYVFVFSVSADQPLTQEVIQKEMLSYYRGLSQSVLKGKQVAVDVDKFTFTMEKDTEATHVPECAGKADGVSQYSGKLDWVEPFASAKSQILYFEMQSWRDPMTAKNYLFVCTSPKQPDDKVAIWKAMRGIRREFLVREALKP
ncbi:MAG: hypothetical protein ACKV19_03790 [Verrucomicrobiales bacterium]